MKIYFAFNEYWARVPGLVELQGPFGSTAEIERKWPAEFATAYPEGLNVGQGGNVSHRISTQLDPV